MQPTRWTTTDHLIWQKQTQLSTQCTVCTRFIFWGHYCNLRSWGGDPDFRINLPQVKLSAFTVHRLLTTLFIWLLRYYQWVNLVMFLQAACFYLPRYTMFIPMFESQSFGENLAFLLIIALLTKSFLLKRNGFFSHLHQESNEFFSK